MNVTQFEAQLVAEVMTQCLEHDWLRGQTGTKSVEKVAGMRYGKRTVLEFQNIFCACDVMGGTRYRGCYLLSADIMDEYANILYFKLLHQDNKQCRIDVLLGNAGQYLAMDFRFINFLKTRR